jgi:hypothetical protein
VLNTIGLYLFVLLAESVSAGYRADANGQWLDVNGQAISCEWRQLYGGAGQTDTAPTAVPQMSERDVDQMTFTTDQRVISLFGCSIKPLRLNWSNTEICLSCRISI